MAPAHLLHSPAVFLTLAALCLLYASSHAGWMSMPMPCFTRQVNRGWADFRPRSVGGFAFGFGLGPGFQVSIAFGAYYVIVLACLLSAEPLVGAMILGHFGLAVGLPVPVIASLMVDRESRESVPHYVDSKAALVRSLRAVSLLVVGVMFLLVAASFRWFP